MKHVTEIQSLIAIIKSGTIRCYIFFSDNQPKQKHGIHIFFNMMATCSTTKKIDSSPE